MYNHHMSDQSIKIFNQIEPNEVETCRNVSCPNVRSTQRFSIRMANNEGNKGTKNSQRKHNKLVCHFCHFADSLIVQLFQTVVFQDDDESWEGVALRCGRSGMNVETKKQKKT
jgi:hypothetical protein